jgi:Ca2+-transporting ATPase
MQSQRLRPPEPARPGEPGIVTFGTDPDLGLDPSEAEARLRGYGPNELPSPHRERWPGRLVRQLRDPMALLLMAAAGVSALALREAEGAVAILAIVVLNAVIGLVQEGRAARALEALRAMETPVTRVLRGGRRVEIPARDVVPGDAVLLAAGDRVPADLHLARATALEADESLLTGESLPVAKGPGTERPRDLREAEAGSIAFAGTLVTRGTATGIAVATGPATELGRIAASLAVPESATPLQAELARVSGRLGTIAIAIAAAVFGLTLLRVGISGDSFQRSFLTAVALAVAAVPEGLATVVAVALALGVRRMAARGAIVRRLPAVETLGSTTVILTDKTGTLTQNRMRLEGVALPARDVVPLDRLSPAAARRVAEVTVLCSDATLLPPAGDPLEIALLEAAGAGADVEELRSMHPRVAALPFDSERRLMATLHRTPSGTFLLLVKGAPEAVIARATEVALEHGGSAPLSDLGRARLLDLAGQMAEGGMRVLALARRTFEMAPAGLEQAERDLALVGLAGLRDHVRPEARQAVAEARSAGIRLVMVTGDHSGTAAVVAEEVGLRDERPEVVTGADIEANGIPQDPAGVGVYARVNSHQKLALVAALQEAGQVVAVTGDGVNDAPALRRADIGVAMGRSGSDVAREAADMVVTDDNLATIVAAVREGRAIYDNIRKVVDYLVAGNLSEITVVLASLLLFPGLGVPLLPLQLLWINLLTDGMPAVALGVDAPDPSLMARSPRSRDDRMLGSAHVALLAGRALLIAAASVASLAIARFAWGQSWEAARSVMFTVLVVAHLVYAYGVRRPGTGRNPWLMGAVAGGIALQLLVVSWPAAHALFATRSATLADWVLVAVAGTLPLLLMHAIAAITGTDFVPRRTAGERTLLPAR